MLAFAQLFDSSLIWLDTVAASHAWIMKGSMDKKSRIFVAGHRGLVGSAVVRHLKAQGYDNLLLRTRQELDLLNQAAVNEFFVQEKPEYVILAAAKVGGILYNQRYQADFLFENMMSATNIIHAAFVHETKKLLFLGSSCIYPKMAPQPLQEESLLSGPLEPTNEGYAIAKIACLKLCEKYALQYGREFISVMPTNLYGPEDNFHPEHSHVIPGLMRRFHEAKLSAAPTVTCWGTGTPRREFLHVDDLAASLLLLMQEYRDPSIINVGTGVDVTLRELAETMKQIVGYQGEIIFDTSKPDGTPRKVLDVSKVTKLGWKPRYTLNDGLQMTYDWAVSNNKFAHSPTSRA